MRAKTIILPSFSDLYDAAPDEIKEYLDRCEITPQSPNWHPEAPNAKVPHNVLAHIKIVFNRAIQSGDINLLMGAFFHDLGKADTTSPNKHGGYSAIGHEIVSSKLVRKYSSWIASYGADPEEVDDIVAEHMRVKQFDQMRKSKQEAYLNHPRFGQINKFSPFDDMSTLTDDEYKIT